MTPAENRDLDLIVVGGGPAGMLAGLLFARAGCQVVVLEKHADFFRDFRGDTVHPSTMEILDELGMLERFLERPHDRLDRAEGRIAGKEYVLGDLSHIHTAAPFIAMMPQWEFLDFLRSEASAFPGFHLRMEAHATRFIEERGRICGVALADGSELRAKLVIAADGRDSIVREQKLLPLEVLGAPMDVLWFRLPKASYSGDALRGSIDSGRMVVLIHRRTYWQTAYLIPKGEAEAIKAKGLQWLQSEVQKSFPDIDFPEDALTSSDDVHLLSVALDRLRRWNCPGLLAIGDAAHAMSPIGGIGINLAIQDAVAAANILAVPLKEHWPTIDGLLPKVQQRRLLPTKVIQSAQKLAQDRIIGTVLSGVEIRRAPLAVRILNAVPLLRRIPGRFIGLGVRRERVRSPNAYA